MGPAQDLRRMPAHSAHTKHGSWIALAMKMYIAMVAVNMVAFLYSVSSPRANERGGGVPAFWGQASTPMDECEGNYEHSPLIAEYWNTVSNCVVLALATYGFRWSAPPPMPSASAPASRARSTAAPAAKSVAKCPVNVCGIYVFLRR